MDKMELQKISWVRTAVIGRGCFGTVSLAVNTSDGGVFAVKSVDKNSALPSQIEALENEIRILRSLSSPYVVECLGDDVTAPFRNMHLEYLPGGTVSDVARSYSGDTPRDEWMIRNHTFCIVSGLKYLHSQGIVHCDVKGDNVLVGATPGTAKLADFGSAMEFQFCGGFTSGKAAVPRGSPLWMAPEVVSGEYQGPESDVWSLGCTVIEMVTGEPAWKGEGAAETFRRIGYSDELPRFPAQLSELGKDFVGKCLRRDVSERWSCDQLLQHPFISMCSPSSLPTCHWSPRCVLDSFNLDSDEEDEGEEEKQRTISDSEVKGRIGKLATEVGAVWESDGWVEVRGINSRETEEEVSLSVSDVGCCGGEGGGTSLEYPELIRIENSGEESEHVDSIGIGELSGRTNEGECLAVDSVSDCSGVVEEVRNSVYNDGVVTNSRRGELESLTGDSHWRCTSQLLVLFYLFLVYSIFDDQICTPFASLRHMNKKLLLLLCKTTVSFQFW